MGVTIKDIAKEAGLSISAVSQVLNNRPCRMTEQNKERIREIARKHNYTANQVARSLVTKKTHMLALIVPDIENLFFSSLAKQLEECCRREGYVLLISNSDDLYSQDQALLKHISTRGVDGIFFIVSNESFQDNRELLKDLQKLPVPFVMIDRVYNNFSCDRISYNNEQGAYIAVKHLLEKGHRKIACVTSPIFSTNGQARLRGYFQAMKEFGCETRSEYIVEGDYRVNSGYDAARRIMETDATAAFISNDMMALGFLKFLQERDLDVPRDFSIVSYDNSLSSLIPGINLTSIDQNPQKLGEEAFALMKKRMEDAGEPRTVSLTPTLVIRDSVKPLN